MLTPKVVLEFVTSEPFRPFRRSLASGRVFEVRHPEMVEVGRSSLTVYAPPESGDVGAERWHKVALMLLESIEAIDLTGAAGAAR